jgi:hypothetical protein
MKNFPEEMKLINVDEIFSSYEFETRSVWPQDLYFWGIKK